MSERVVHVVSFSGGKDSVATWLYLARELGLDVLCLFADTGHEAPETYEYLEYLERHHGLQLARVRACERLTGIADSDEPVDLLKLAKWKRRFPFPTARFCTTELKLVPCRAWLMGAMWMDPLTTFRMASGVRAQESRKRATADPRLMLDDFMGVDRWLPIHDWTVEEVFEIHRRHRVPVNPLYLDGMSRVGCFPCIHANKSDLAAMAHRHPWAFDRLKHMEREAGKIAPKGLATFFPAGTVSDRYCSTLDPKTGAGLATAEDVRRWALSETPVGAPAGLRQLAMFVDEEGDDPEAPSCSSVYGLCE